MAIQVNFSNRTEQLVKKEQERQIRIDNQLAIAFPLTTVPILSEPTLPLPNFKKKDLTLGVTHFKLDIDQQKATDALYAGKSMVLLGSAGSGKSTIMGQWLNEVIHRLPPIGMETEAYYQDIGVNPVHSRYTPGMPGFAGCAYTVRATAILAASGKPLFKYESSHRNHDGELVKLDTIYTASELFNTLNSFAGYRPKRMGEEMEEDGDSAEDVLKDRSRFNASRDRDNPNDPNFKLLVIDEASFAAMVSLGNEAIGSVMRTFTQVVIMGDLAQLQAIGGMSILQVACLHLPIYELTGQHRSAGVLLNFVQAVRDFKLTTFFLKWNPNACTVNGKLKPTNKAITFKDTEGKTVMLVPFTPKEQREPSMGESKVARFLFSLVVRNFITLGVHIVMIPQRTGRFGSIRVVEELNTKLDAHYKRGTYYYRSPTSKPKAANETILAVGDIMQMNREPHLVVGIYPNPTYSGDTPSESFYNRPRCASTWLQIHEAHDNIAQRETLIDVELNEVPEEDIDFEHDMLIDMQEELLDSNIREEDIIKMGKTSHQLLLIDLAYLLKVCKEVYDDKESYLVQSAIVNTMSAWAMHYDSLADGIFNATAMMVKFRLKSAEIQEHYGIGNMSKCFILYTGTKQLDEHSKAIITAYQSQGSESPIAITVLHPKMEASQCVNEAAFTMMSRARETTIVIAPTTYFNATSPSFSPMHRAIKGITTGDKLKITRHTLNEYLANGDRGIAEAISIFEELLEQNDHKSGSVKKLWWENNG